MSAVTLPLSMLSSISLCILRRAVSVERNRLYADCRYLINDAYKYVHEGD